jgi:predicted secreted protein
MTTEAKAGCDALVKVNTGTEQSPVWTAVGAQKDSTLNRGTNAIDTTSKDGLGWESKMAGFKNWSLDFDNFYVQDDAGFLLLEAAFEDREPIQVQVAYPDGTIYSGSAIITSAPAKQPIKDAIVVSFKLDGAGPLTNNLGGTVTTPTITTPADNATNVVVTASFETSAFAVSAGSDTHTSTQIQVTEATDAVFATPVIDTMSTVDLEEQPVASGVLEAATEYLVRVRYHGAKYGWSAWSEVTSFTTAS